MRVPGSDIPRVEVDAHLDDLASGRAEIVPLQVGSFGSRLLSPCHVQRESACDDQHRCRDDSNHLHGYLLERMRPGARRPVYQTKVSATCSKMVTKWTTAPRMSPSSNI
jgi:hypothetical protein